MDLSKRTKIVCTIGPSSDTKEKMIALTKAGMNVCRLNFSHGTHEDHAKLIARIRETAKETGEPLTILQDLQGPKIRVGELPKEGVVLNTGSEAVFTTGIPNIPETLPVTYDRLHEDVKPGQIMLFDDGLLSAEVVRVDGQNVHVKMTHGGTLFSHKGMNLPETKTSISAISEKDRDDLRFGVEQGVDWVALSFVRSAEDVRELRAMIAEDEKELQRTQVHAPIKIIAKIEKPEAVEQIDEIINEVDGVMVARGDLGIEIPAAKVPAVQKMIIAKCLAVAKPVIVATQMLDSMIRNPRATRAEISDIANAVVDHADATMLSGETATGSYPIEAVQTMAETIRETEHSGYDDLAQSMTGKKGPNEAMTNIAGILAYETTAKAILVVSQDPLVARLVSRHRPEIPVFAAVGSEQDRCQLNIEWGVRPFLSPVLSPIHEAIPVAIRALLPLSGLEAQDEIIVVAGEPLGKTGNVHLVELRTIGE